MKSLLRDIAVITAGQGAPQGESNYCDNGIPFVKAGNLLELIEGKDIKEIQNVSEEVARSNKLKLYPKGTILFAKSGMSCLKGYVYVLPQNAYVVSHLACITPKEEISNYLKYYFTLHRPNRLIKDASYPSISLNDIGELEIDIKSPNERERIVEVLDSVSNLIKKNKEELQKLDELIKARFVEMFGDPEKNPKKWDVVKISEILNGKATNGFFAKRDDYFEEGNVQILGVVNVVNRMYSGIKNLPRTNGTEIDIEKYGVKYGDMLFCRSSLVAEGIGKASIVPEDVDGNILFECHVIRLPLDLSICVPEFVQVLSTTDYFRKQIIANSKTATMTTIGQDGILKTNIILPHINKQKEFYKFVKQLDKSKSVVQKSLDETQKLFDSLMQQYFG